MYSKKVVLKTSFEISIANLTLFKEGLDVGEIFSLEFWIYLFDLSVLLVVNFFLLETGEPWF